MQLLAEKYLTVREFLEFLGVPDMPQATVHGLIRRGCLHKVERRGMVLIEKSEAIRWQGVHKIYKAGKTGERYGIKHLAEDPLPKHGHRKLQPVLISTNEEPTKELIAKIFLQFRILLDQLEKIVSEM